MTLHGQCEHPPSGYDERAVKLPNGCWIEPGGRVRVPAEHLHLQEVIDAAKEHGWRLEPGAETFASEVIYWPRSS